MRTTLGQRHAYEVRYALGSSPGVVAIFLSCLPSPISPSTCPLPRLPSHLLTHLSVLQPTHTSVNSFIHLSICPPTNAVIPHPSIYPSMPLCIIHPLTLSTHSLTHVSISLSIHSHTNIHSSALLLKISSSISPVYPPTFLNIWLSSLHVPLITYSSLPAFCPPRHPPIH